MAINIMEIITKAEEIVEGIEEISEALDVQMWLPSQRVLSNSSPTTSKLKAKITALFIHSK
jgi:hypothetical protein